MKVDVDIDKELSEVANLLSKHSKLGISGFFALNVILVLGLARICIGWTNSSSDVSKSIQIAIVVLAFVCLALVPFIYILFRYVDKTAIPVKDMESESKIEVSDST